MSQPDLFVVCKNCQAEVSPYVTECPYCGTRLRKRAPKIERPDAHARQAAAPRAARRRRAEPPEAQGAIQAAGQARQAGPRPPAQRRDPGDPRRRDRQAVGDDRPRRDVVRHLALARVLHERRPRAERAERRPVAVPDGVARQRRHRRAVRDRRRARALRLAPRAPPRAAGGRRALLALRPGRAGDRGGDRSRHVRLRLQRRGAGLLVRVGRAGPARPPKQRRGRRRRPARHARHRDRAAARAGAVAGQLARRPRRRPSSARSRGSRSPRGRR